MVEESAAGKVGNTSSFLFFEKILPRPQQDFPEIVPFPEKFTKNFVKVPFTVKTELLVDVKLSLDSRKGPTMSRNSPVSRSAGKVGSI